MQRGRYKLPAVVLSRTNYGEADLIVRFLTRDQGKISGLAKHARKSMKRFGGIFTSLAMVELDFTVTPGRDLVRLENGELLTSFEAVANDIRVTALAGYGLELVDCFSAPQDPAPEVFELLVWFLNSLAEGGRPMETALVFQIRLLKLAGFAPSVSSCGVCSQAALDGRELTLSASKGGVVCRSCSPSGFPVTAGSLKLMEFVQSLELDKVGRARASDRVIGEVQPFLRAYVTYILGRELKSARVMDQVLREKVK